MALIAGPVRKRRSLGAPGPPRQPDPELVLDQHAPDRRLRNPHQLLVGAAVRELAVRAVALLVGLEDGQDRRLLGRGDRVHRVPTRRGVLQRPRGPAFAPAPRPALAELQIRAGAAVIPAVGDRTVDELQQRELGGRLDTPRNPATQSQRPFPSVSMSLTPISLIASVSRAISGVSATSSGSGPLPIRTPVVDAASASSAPWRATMRSVITVDRSPPDRSAAAAIVYSPRIRLSQISYLSLGDKNRLPRRPRRPVPLPLDCGSLIFARSWMRPTGSQMRTDYRGEVWREVRRKPHVGSGCGCRRTRCRSSAARRRHRG